LEDLPQVFEGLSYIARPSSHCVQGIIQPQITLTTSTNEHIANLDLAKECRIPEPAAWTNDIYDDVAKFEHQRRTRAVVLGRAEAGPS
jgi:hypothetical protein